MEENREFFLIKTEEAVNAIRDTISRIEAIDNRLLARTNHRDRSGLTRQILFSAGWVLFYLVFGMITLLSGYRGITILVNIIGIISGTWIALILLMNNLNTAKFYWNYLDYRTELGKIRENLNARMQNMSEERSLLVRGEETEWDRKLEIKKPISLTLREIEKKIGGIPGFDANILQESNSLLFFIAACFGTCAFGYQLLMRVYIPLTKNVNLGAGLIRGAGITALLIASGLEFFVARGFLARGEGEINNFSLLAIPVGAVGSLLLAGLLLLVAYIGGSVWRWVRGLLGLAFVCGFIILVISGSNR